MTSGTLPPLKAQKGQNGIIESLFLEIHIDLFVSKKDPDEYPRKRRRDDEAERQKTSLGNDGFRTTNGHIASSPPRVCFSYSL